MCFVVTLAHANDYSVEYKNAYTYAYSKWITTIDSIQNAKMYWSMTRIEMAKMISVFAINVLWLKPDSRKECNFSDVDNGLDASYSYWVTKACRLWLMWINSDWSTADYFNPTSYVTRWEWATVFSRVLNKAKWTSITNWDPFYKTHLNYLISKWIIKNYNNPSPSSEEKRWNVMLMMYRADETLNYDNLKITWLLWSENAEWVALFLDTTFKVVNLNEQNINILKEIFKKDKSEFQIVNLIPENFEFSESAISDWIEPYYMYKEKRYISPNDTIYKYKDWFIRIYKSFDDTDCISLYNEKLDIIASYEWIIDAVYDYEYHYIIISHIILDQLIEDAFYMDSDSWPYWIIDYNWNYIHADHWTQEKGKIQWILSIPESLNIFWEEYALKDYWSSYYEDFFWIKVELEDKITRSIKESWQMFREYTVRFKEYPTLLITYNKPLDFDIPEAIFKSNFSRKTDNKGNIIDLNQTKYLTCYFWIEWTDIKCKDKPTVQLSQYESVLRGDEYDIIPLNSSTIPFYRIRQSNIPWYYYFYAADWKYLWYWFDLWKPVIYVYDSQNRKNTLNVELVDWWRFKHVEPQFTTWASWDFVSDEYSNIIIDNETYPYMYYTSTAPWYKLNEYWWIVLWEDVEHFLNTKLDTIWLYEKERNDFIEYWLPFFDANSKYFISFKFNEELDLYAKLLFKYEPERINRVFMEAIEIWADAQITYSKENSTENDEKYLRKFKRWGFEALEWWAYLKSL